MVSVFLGTALAWCLMICTSIVCNDGRPSEITKGIAITAAIGLGLMAYTWAVIWAVTTLAT